MTEAPELIARERLDLELPPSLNAEELASRINAASGGLLPDDIRMDLLVNYNHLLGQDSWGLVRIERYGFNETTKSFYRGWKDAMYAISIAERDVIIGILARLQYNSAIHNLEEVLRRRPPYSQGTLGHFWTVGMLRSTPIDELVSYGSLSVTKADFLLKCFQKPNPGNKT